ncbi:uncharacterized protein LOC131723312 isoform X1 [Acipenser ruthenus]|uniref:uncharacterized protein LOC131723312 isoform X1 n=1 Tax=Acipenser ruthenus TaxID=7906 RepID=UPI00145B4B79|nr:uncharacterized protein LOC131723312 isoform X1 [Acipenser ruthenus]
MFKKQTSPEVVLEVEGKEITFLIDTGAARSVIKKEDAPHLALSDDSVLTIGASGQANREVLTKPVNVKCNKKVVTHSFICSQLCPVNLCGRDLLTALCIKIECNPGGIIVDIPIMYTDCTHQSDWLYAWDLLPGKRTAQLEQLTVEIWGHEPERMPASRMHCTALYSNGQRDFEFENTWFETTETTPAYVEYLETQYLYWSEDFAALSIILTSEQQKVYEVKTGAPHVSLAKRPGCAWKDLGPWVLKLSQLGDWVTVPKGEFSPSGQAYRMLKRGTWVCHRVMLELSAAPDPQHLMMMGEGGEPDWLKDIPQQLWPTSKNDFGLIKDCEPLVVKPKSTHRPKQKQYPLGREAIDGIRPLHEELVKRGAIVPATGARCNSPILPVRKANGEWRFVQDLRLINLAVHQRTPIVPNPITCLSGVPPSAKWFSVIDLANAFYSVPIEKGSQEWFAFVFEGKQWTWTRMPQGYTESPAVFSAAMQANLAGFIPPRGGTLIQYVDDLLLCSESVEASEIDTRALLCFLAREGHKVNRQKLQLCKREVTYLGHLLSAEGKSLCKDRVEAILKIPQPVTKKQMMTFLGMTGYCRAWILDYATKAQPLQDLIHTNQMKMTDTITWTTDSLQAFEELKQGLTANPCLGIPNHEKPFNLYVSEKDGFMSAVLTQRHGDKQRPVGYYSKRMDSVVRGKVACIRAVAAASEAVSCCVDLVQMSELIVQVPHAVSALLNQCKTAHLTPARLLHYQNVLLTMPNVTIQRCTNLNPATLLPNSDDGEPHDCQQIIEIACTPRPDLRDEPLENPDLVLYVDGSAQRNNKGEGLVAYAVVTDSCTIEAKRLPSHWSAQAAELVALTRACLLSEEQTVTIYTDSRYAFGVVHDYGALWKLRDFLTASGKPINNGELVKNLLEAIQRPREIAVVKCAAHTNSTDIVSLGNARADAAAKAAAQSGDPGESVYLCNSSVVDQPFSLQDIIDLQASADEKEKRKWKKEGGRIEAGLWLGPNGKPILPRACYPLMCKWAHGLDHVSKGGVGASCPAGSS